MSEVIILIELPGGAAGAFFATEVVAARARAVDLGLAEGVSIATAPARREGAERRSYTAAELASQTGLPARLFLSRARAGELPHRKVGRRVLFPASVLDAERRAPAPKAVASDDVVPWTT